MKNNDPCVEGSIKITSVNDGRIKITSVELDDNITKKTFEIGRGDSFFISKNTRDPEERGHEQEHLHEFIELVYILKGECTHYINGIPYIASRGDMLFINYGETHSFDVHSPMIAYNFLIKPEFISENLVNSETINDIFLALLPESSRELQKSKTSCVRFSGEDRLEIERISEKMYREVRDERPCFSLILNSYMKLILALLIRKLLQSSGDERPNILTTEILEYLDGNFTSPISAASLAEHCFYNPAYLGRVFKAVHGQSIKEYIRTKRMEYAMNLLKTTDLSIEEIYVKVGYSAKAQFYKNFKDYYGDSPKKFRNQ